MANKKYVILIQPKEVDVDLVVNKPYLPLALLSISRYIHQKYSVVIIDQRIDRDWEEKLLEYSDKDVICTGISCLLGNQIKYCLQVSELVKANFKCPVIWGGIHDPELIKQVLESSVADGIVQGEGEEIFTEAVERLATGQKIENIPGYWSIDQNGYGTDAKSLFLNMDLLPDLPYHLINIQRYARYRGGDYTISFESSRGCNYKCGFCACPQYSYLWRGKSANKVVSDIKYLTEELKIKAIFVVDDNFFGDIERAKEIFGRLIDEKIKVNLDIYGMRIDVVEKLSDDDFERMVKAGVRKVVIGVESGSDRVLRFINKGITVAQVLKQNRKISKYGIYVQYNFITGYPTETLSEVRQTINLALQLIKENKRAMINYFCIFVPLPGSKLYKFEKERGMPVPKTINEWVKYDRLFVSNREGVDLNRKLNIISLFVDKKVNFYAKSLFLRFLVALYRPFARFRMRHLFFGGFLEGRVFTIINRSKFKLDK